MTENTPLLLRSLGADIAHPGANEVDDEVMPILSRGPQPLVDVNVDSQFPVFSAGGDFSVGVYDPDADMARWIREGVREYGFNGPREWTSPAEWRRDIRVLLNDLSITAEKSQRRDVVKRGVVGLTNLAGRLLNRKRGPTHKSPSARSDSLAGHECGDIPNHAEMNGLDGGRRRNLEIIGSGRGGHIAVARGDKVERLAPPILGPSQEIGSRKGATAVAVGSYGSTESTPRAADFVKSRFRRRGRWTWVVQSQLNRRLEALGDSVVGGGKTSPRLVAQWFEQVFGPEVKPSGVRAVKQANVDGKAAIKEGDKPEVAPVDALVSVRVVGEAEELLVSLDLVAMLVNYMAFRPRHVGTLALLRVKALAFAKKLELNQRYLSLVIHGSCVLGMLVPLAEQDAFVAMEGAAGDAIVGWSERLNRGLLRDRSLVHRIQDWCVWGANRAVWGLLAFLALEQVGFWELAGTAISTGWSWLWSVLGLSMPAIHIAWYVYLGVAAAILVPVVGGLALWLRPRALLVLPRV